MTGQETYDLVTEIRGGRPMDETVFYTLANLAKSTLERARAWRILVKKDSSKSSTSATTYDTSFALPTGFLMTLPRRTLKLVNASSPTNIIELTEVLWEQWDEFKNSGGYFTIDHANAVYYVSSIVSATYTHRFSFIGTSTTIAAGTSWVFPAEFHPAIAFDVAARDELGIDYDDINARQGNANLLMVETIKRSAIKWDDTLVRSALGA